MKRSSGKEALKLMVIVVVMVSMCSLDESQQLCGLSYVSLATCLPAIQQPSPAEPTKVCCSGLKQGNVTCLCGYKEASFLKDFKIDAELVLKLPTKCNISNVPC
ncbi:hypothetical protein MLD38_018623 [Melastoma candidum]|uniref:Uncharacterized protein n=1 Tax=Melastoma candidum TaxID=119954 RepID=A0ACB9QWB3_9MYRT|nr:hypothetical protein MLD38_018623 [Melastoma candidum]